MTKFLAFIKTTICCAIAASAIACSSEDVPKGRILIRNDIQDSRNNEIVVDQILSKSGLTSSKLRLRPGEKSLLPNKQIRSMRFSRKYDDLSRVYVVKCPTPLREGIIIKLIDVHTGRLKGGCSLTKKGKKKAGIIYWEQK